MATKLTRYAQRVLAYHSIIRCVHPAEATLSPWRGHGVWTRAVRGSLTPVRWLVGSLLAYVAGIGVLLALPMLAKVTYFSENALLTGAGPPYYRIAIQTP